MSRRPRSQSPVPRGGVARLTGAILALGGSLFALVFLYAVLHHDRYWVGGPRIVLYYAAPLALAAALFAALRLRPLARARLALLLVSSAVCVYAVEGLLALQAPGQARRLARRLGRPWDERSRLELLLELRAGGVDAWPAVYPRELVNVWLEDSAAYALRLEGQPLLPLGGIARAITVFCNEGGQHIVYDSDDHGFHNPPGAWRAARVAALGDSFTHGTCVPSSQNMVARIRQQYPATINLGLGGDGPLLELAKLREFLPALRPEVVLWFYYEGNDLSMDLDVEQRHPLLRRYLEEPTFRQSLSQRAPEVDAALRDWVEGRIERMTAGGELPAMQRLRDVAKLHHLRTALGLALGRGAADFATFRRVLEQARDEVRGWGGRLVFVYLPDRNRYARHWSRGEDRMRREVLGIARGLRLPVVDVHAAFGAAADSPLRLFDLGAHYSPEGYRVAADAVLALLDEQVPKP